MAPASLQSILGAHPLDGLFEASPPQERVLFESLWQQVCRHAPLFGYADHRDVDSEHLDRVQDAVHEQLAGWARKADARAVEQQAVRATLNALRSARGLAIEPPRPEIATLLEPANQRLCAVVQCAHVPLFELFHYHRSLDRHYSIHREHFTELIDWCITAITADDPPEFVRRFVADIRRLSPPRFLDPPPAPASIPAPPDDLPPAVHASPLALAAFVAASAPERAEFGAGPFTLHDQAILTATPQRWHDILSSVLREDLTRLPPLVENALLVHVLGLEDRHHKAVLSDAADHLLVHHFIPAAREVGARQNRHEPIAVLLVGVVATALRPWSFTAPELTTPQRIVLLALLAELATAKSRKVLHQEKQHAESHEHPELIRAGVNRALARWPERVHAVSPKQRIDRVAAGFRYLNRLRRGVDPRARDRAIVADMLGATQPEAPC